MRSDPAPWDDVDAALATPPTLTEAHDRDLVETIVDDARAVMVSYRDPESVDRYVRALRPAMRQRVRDLLAAQAEQRIDVPRITPAVVAPEVRLAADIADTLEGIAGAMMVGAEEARAASGELLADVVEVKPIGTTSQRFPDGHGRDIKVEHTQGSAPTVNADEVIDVVADYLTAHHGPSVSPDAELLIPEDEDAEHDETTRAVIGVAVAAYNEGARAGMAEVMRLASLSWRTTALKALAADLAAIPTQEAAVLAIRLEQAQGRRLVGDPKIKLTRVEETKR